MIPRTTKGSSGRQAKQYMDLRQPHVNKILDHAQQWQDRKRDKTAVEEYIMYAFMWMMGWFPNVMTKPLKQLVEYNIASEVHKVLNAKS
ncbi:hypothetical protein J3458_009189 [Metarhizium acridum]|uniref:uncharacterized protein n=1 Tax=Metarhizium acridum TaxID=92637 RepID=UPI001C6C5975|nr:hypothetical protein J3458_009189 [Metarhizium acridum]